MTQKDASKPVDLQAKSAIIFIGLIVITSALCLPLLYYSVRINALVMDAGVVGAVRITDYWVVALGGVVYQAYRQLAYKITGPWHMALCLEKDPVKRERYI